MMEYIYEKGYDEEQLFKNIRFYFVVFQSEKIFSLHFNFIRFERSIFPINKQFSHYRLLNFMMPNRHST